MERDLIEQLLTQALELSHANIFLADEVHEFDQDLASAIRGTARASKTNIEAAITWVTDDPPYGRAPS